MANDDLTTRLKIEQAHDANATLAESGIESAVDVIVDKIVGMLDAQLEAAWCTGSGRKHFDRTSASIQIARILREHGEEMWQGLMRDDAVIERRAASGFAELLAAAKTTVIVLEYRGGGFRETLAVLRKAIAKAEPQTKE